MRRGVRAALWVATPVLAVVVVPSAAHAGSTTLTLRGTAPGYVDVRTTRAMTFDLAKATYTGPGSYTGVYVDRIRPWQPALDLLGVLHRTVLFAPKPKPDVLGFASRSFPAGTYRLYLLGSGSSSVAIPVDGLDRARTVTVARRISVHYVEHALPVTLSPGTDGLYHAEDRLPVTLGARPLLYHRAAVRFAAPTVAKYGLDTCLVRHASTEPCEVASDNVAANLTAENGQAAAEYADSYVAANGAYDAVARYHGTGQPTSGRVALLTVALSAAPPMLRATLGPVTTHA